MASQPMQLSRREALLAGAAAWGAASLPGYLPAQVPADAFPRDFLWGTATAAYQVEGAAAEDGRGPSVWDTFCRKKGAVYEGHTGEVACDHYHRLAGDVRLMKELGIGAYRFSVSWSRVLPEGRGRLNPKGLAFYDRLLDSLAGANIVPACTLFHWDFPEALFQQGGWLNRDVANWFADYASLLASRFSDRVVYWITQNEPQCYIGLGHLEGRHAPGLKLKFGEYLRAAHHSMRAHALAVRAIRAAAKHPSTQVGYVLATQVAHPASDSSADREAARQVCFRVEGRNAFNNAWWLDPVLEGRYPADGLAAYAADMPKGFEADLAEMKQPLDFLGLNIYTSRPWRQGSDGKPEQVKLPPGYPLTGVDWQPVMPQSLYWGPKFFFDRYRLPIHITENGLSTRDQISLDGAVHDPQRIDLTQRYLLELHRAMTDGVPVKSYYHWSLLDNFEWAEGYKQRFGLVYVDYPTQKRLPKDSYHWYRGVIASRGKSLFGARAMPAAQMTASG